MQNQLVNAISPAFGGPYGLQAYLMPPGFAGAFFEGPWVPLAGAKSLALEIAGALGGGTLSLQLVGTNDPSVASVNKYTVTFGGSVSNNDSLSAAFSNPNLPNGLETVTVTATGSDTTTTLATAMAAAINADVNLQAVGISASSAAAIVTVSYPSLAPESAPPQGPPSQGGTALFANYTSVVVSKTGTTTITAADGSGGTNVGTALAALGLTAIAAPLPLFIKARMTLSGATNPSVTAALSAAI